MMVHAELPICDTLLDLLYIILLLVWYSEYVLAQLDITACVLERLGGHQEGFSCAIG